MSSSGGSFFPRVESVFYAVFDVRQGPKVVYQVPEGLISCGSSTSSSNALYSPSPASSTLSLGDSQRLDSRHLLSPQKRSGSSNRSLFNFDDISKYVMPPSALCGRLVICTSRKHRIIGFPVELRGSYERNYFRYNLCFVFERNADLSCYEPVVRKVSRVLTSCEEESEFLSNPQSSPAIHAILEQLYEDLNSYSETSIPIDKFNSIELKIFPFYPNPPPVKDWMVPLALINITKRIEPNWDLTMVKVCQLIDGTNHVCRIARLADCDVELVRQAISHLLYYQVIMMIDIFQYSNMYTLRTSVQWLADESHVRDECGPYATKPGHAIADWPKLLHLYSRLKPGKTVREWMVEHEVESLGIDVRRFTSFGVIKGFLRRVHRWPILVPDVDMPQDERHLSSSIGRKRGKSFVSPAQQPRVARTDSDSIRARGRPQEALPTTTPAPAEIFAVHATPVRTTRRNSAAEASLEQLRVHRPAEQIRAPSMSRVYGVNARSSLSATFGSFASAQGSIGPTGVAGAPDSSEGGGIPAVMGHARSRFSRSPSGPVVSQVHAQAEPAFPADLIPLLDGEHNTDELCTRFEVGLPMLRKWLVAAGGGKGEDDFGSVSIIYR
ncbi:NPR2-domain-containing protein [Amylocystis lapponica]|nr:NPR2-domain-containing protein [Amylocystis lapponica]